MEPTEPLLERLRELVGEGGEGEAEAAVRSVVRRLRAVTQRPLRRTVLRQAFEEVDDAGLLALLNRVLEGAREGRTGHREVLQELALDPWLLLEMPYDRLSDLYRAARGEGLEQVAAMFLGDSRPQVRPPPPGAVQNQHMDRSAGERRSAARGRDRFVLDRILHDRDPRVIQQVLENPRLLEADVVRIAAMRPTRPEILATIAGHRAWSSRYRIREALVCNPYTPAPIAARLISTLLMQDIACLVERASLRPLVEEAAKRELHRRGWKRPSEE